MNWETGTDTYILPHVKQITNKDYGLPWWLRW